MGKVFLFSIAFFLTTNVFSQTSVSKSEVSSSEVTSKKTLTSKRISQPIAIDGKLDEAEWQNAEIAKDFVMLEPNNGVPLDETKKAEVKVLYDNEAIYIGAFLKDDPKLIMKEITQRDDDGSADFFGLSVNGYNDGQQEFRFFVTAAGVQLDANANSQTGEDFSWDAIWSSEVAITADGWYVEIKLPYSALRFSKEQQQTWGIQFFRQIRRDRQLYTWNRFDNTKGSLEQQSGELKGLENIKTPTRLFFFPYASAYLNSNKEAGTKIDLKGGLDIKYGINDAFTLDAILVPDFGQTAFDNQILNLGPFEQQFNENRPFFTEGTDLFNKGNLFYSRRIGGEPSYYPETSDNEEVIDFPLAVNLLNALKVSGRTKDGLGVGILNAITEKTDVTVRKTITNLDNSITLEDRKEVIEPLANYNIITLDQRFNKNSSISFVNTNVTRNGIFQDANVSALVWDLNTTKNTWNLGGDFKYSYVNPYDTLKDKNGINTSLYIGETSGKIRYSVRGEYISKEFDNNDLGINFQTNYHGIYANLNYRLLKPTNVFNTMYINVNANSQFQNTSGKLQAGNINFNLNASTKKNDGIGGGIFIRPFKVYDFYMPRTPERYFLNPEYFESWIYFSSNYNRKFAIDINPTAGTTSVKNWNTYGFNFSPRYRFSNKVLLIAGYEYNKEYNSRGFFKKIGDEIIIENRDINTTTLYAKLKYALNNKMTININSRYYWSYVQHKKFSELQQNGTVNNTNFTALASQDFSAWNIDCSYSWWIAPGSQLNVLYRNNSANFNRRLSTLNRDFGDNFNNLFGDKLNHTFSVSLRYFLDFNKVKNWF